MSDIQTKFSMENLITGGKALSRLPDETPQRHPQSLSEGFRHTNKLHRSDQSDDVSSTKEQRSLKERESVNAETAKPRPMDHQQIP